MLDLMLAIAGGSLLLGAVALAIRVDRIEARNARPAGTWRPVRLPPLDRSPRRVRLVRLDT